MGSPEGAAAAGWACSDMGARKATSVVLARTECASGRPRRRLRSSSSVSARASSAAGVKTIAAIASGPRRDPPRGAVQAGWTAESVPPGVFTGVPIGPESVAIPVCSGVIRPRGCAAVQDHPEQCRRRTCHRRHRRNPKRACHLRAPSGAAGGDAGVFARAEPSQAICDVVLDLRSASTGGAHSTAPTARRFSGRRYAGRSAPARSQTNLSGKASRRRQPMWNRQGGPFRPPPTSSHESWVPPRHALDRPSGRESTYGCRPQ